MISPSVPFSVFFVLLFFYLNVLQTTIAFPLSPYAKLLSRADHGGSNLSHRGMNTHVARILGISISMSPVSSASNLIPKTYCSRFRHHYWCRLLSSSIPSLVPPPPPVATRANNPGPIFPPATACRWKNRLLQPHLRSRYKQPRTERVLPSTLGVLPCGSAVQPWLPTRHSPPSSAPCLLLGRCCSSCLGGLMTRAYHNPLALVVIWSSFSSSSLPVWIPPGAVPLDYFSLFFFSFRLFCLHICRVSFDLGLGVSRSRSHVPSLSPSALCILEHCHVLTHLLLYLLYLMYT